MGELRAVMSSGTQQGACPHQRNVIAVQQDLVELSHTLALSGDLTAIRRFGGRSACKSTQGRQRGQRWHNALLCHVLEHHVDVVVEASQRAHQLLVTSHDDPHP